jgi:5-methylcytosine-specific restriction endonuclease McrA
MSSEEDKKARNRNYMRERRKKAKATGMCPQHINNKIVEEFSSCQECIDKNQQKYITAKMANVCLNHPLRPSSPGSVLCDECLNTNAERKRNNIIKAKLNGMCIHHPTRKAEIGSFCEECWFRDISSNALNTSWKEIRQLLIDQNFLCIYTGEKLIPGHNASLDHIIPRAKGGECRLFNVQWVTEAVNCSKHDIMPDRFLQIIDLIAQRFNLNVN